MSCASCNSGAACTCANSNYKQLDFGTRVIYTLGGAHAGSGVDIVVSDSSIAATAPTLAQLQATLTVGEATNGFVGKVYYQVSADSITWDNPAYFQSGGGAMVQTGNGTVVSDWVTGVSNFKRFIRFGVHAEQSSTNDILAIAQVGLVVGVLIK